MKHYFDIDSVLIYLSIFIGSLIFVGVAEYYLYKKDGTIYKGQRRLIGIIFLSIAILIPCLFASFRGLKVGLDINTYIINNFQFGQRSGISFSYFQDNMPIPTEFLFTLLIFICCKIGDIHLLFFLIEVLIIVPLAIVMVKKRGKGSLVLEFALFYFLFFNFTLSGMRQSIAMSFLTVALFEILDGRKKKALLLTIIAQLFHASVILIVILILICFFINNSKRKRMWISLFVIGLIMIIFAFSFYAGKIADFVGIINPRYKYFIWHYLHSGFNFEDVPSTDIVVKSILVFMPLWLASRKKYVSDIDKLMLMFTLLGRYFVLFNGVFYESMRIAYYFDYFIIFYVPRSLISIRNRTNRLSYKLIYICLAVTYWLYFIMHIGGYGTNIVTFNI